MSSYSSRAITFTFGQILLGKVWTPLSSQLWVKYYHYCSSRRMALALNNLKRVDMPLNKETKPNQTYTLCTFTPFLNFKVGHFARYFLFLSFSVAMKGIQFTLPLYHISSLIHLVHHLFYFYPGMYDCWIHVNNSTCSLFEWWILVGLFETAVCGFCLSVSLHWCPPFSYFPLLHEDGNNSLSYFYQRFKSHPKFLQYLYIFFYLYFLWGCLV